MIHKAILFLRKAHTRFAYKKVLVLGDSHVEVFNSRRFILNFFRYTFKVVSVGGATASGLENPNSQTQAVQIFKNALENNKSGKVIVMLGEVDTGFVIWYRSQKYVADLNEMFKQAIDNYCLFLSSINNKFEVLVISTTLPTIDDKSRGDVVRTRKEVTATQKERTELTLKFNQAINEYCLSNNVDFLNLDPYSLSSKGLVKDKLKNLDPTDHYYDFDEYSKLIIKQLKINKFL